MKRIIMTIIVTAVLLFTFTPMSAKAADYKVQSRDTLNSVSKLFKVTPDTIKLDNFLHSSRLKTGQILYVPAKVYKVKSGDTMNKIANKYKITVTSIKKANGKSSRKIKVGEKLMLPGITPSSSKGAVIPYTNREVDLLARLITAEAGGETYEAMVGVGGVVVNRVQSKDWPNSISSVIYQVINGYYQFTPVKNGMIDRPASDLAVRAAWAALYGKDPSNDAMFYFDDSATNPWIWSKPQTAYIDSMVFVK